MPVDLSRYPADWHAIRARIMTRANGHCEWCGVPDGAQGWRNAATGGFYALPADARPPAAFCWFDPQKGVFYRDPDRAHKRAFMQFAQKHSWLRIITIVLTTAHLGVPKPDGTPGDKHDKRDCRDENLAMLCQACHLNYDRDEHIHTAALNRRGRQIQSGQQELF